MKKALKLSAVSLIIALIVTTVGGVMISRANVNIGDVYDIIADTVQISEPNVSYTRPEPPDLSGFPDLTTAEYLTYQLNEFNSVEIFGEHCSVEFSPTNSDLMIVYIDYPDVIEGKFSLQTAVKDGTLYVENKWHGNPISNYESTVIYVYVPENYKGGYSINGSFTDVKLCDLDSSMNISMNMYNSTVTTESLSAREISMEFSGTSGTIGAVVSKGGFSLSGISATLDVNRIDAVYSKTVLSNSTVNLKNLVGSLTADMQMGLLNIDCLTVTGNISVTNSKGRVDINIPKNSSVSLRHEESYSIFSDKVNWADIEQNNEDLRHIIDTKVEFGIVTLAEKE